MFDAAESCGVYLVLVVVRVFHLNGLHHCLIERYVHAAEAFRASGGRLAVRVIKKGRRVAERRWQWQPLHLPAART